MVFGHALQWAMIYLRAKIYQENYAEEQQKTK
jgi:hypothetical protein